jgi:hypothetical protein
MIVTVVMTASCVTSRKCLKRFPPSSESTVIERTKDSLIYRDTTLYVTLPGKIVRDSVSIPCPTLQPPQGGAKSAPDTAFAETDLASAKAWYSRQRVHLELVQKDTTLQLQLDNAIKESFHWKSEFEKSKTIQQVKYIPDAYRIAFWLWIFVFFIIALFLLLKYKVGLFKN